MNQDQPARWMTDGLMMIPAPFKAISAIHCQKYYTWRVEPTDGWTGNRTRSLYREARKQSENVILSPVHLIAFYISASFNLISWWKSCLMPYFPHQPNLHQSIFIWIRNRNILYLGKIKRILNVSARLSWRRTRRCGQRSILKQTSMVERIHSNFQGNLFGFMMLIDYQQTYKQTQTDERITTKGGSRQPE